MSFQMNVAPSQMARLVKKVEVEDGEEAEEEGPQRKKREDYKKLKELEEMRKAGTAPAMKDEEGRDINPHIPQYIMQAPWYYNVTQATLKHQRMQPQDVREFSKMSQWYNRGAKEEGVVATKFRKGACENCGALTHKKVDCLERPRKVSAKFSGTNFAPDESVQPELDFDFEGKRDRWNGYDMSDHKRVVDEHHKIEEAKKLLKAQKFDKDASAGGAQEPDEALKDSDDDDEDKYAEDVLMPGQKFETKQRITVRNLRIREDTAKYLHNLNTNSAHYDPKTRSMRENPFEGTGKKMGDIPYAGDNFVRYSGDAMHMAKQQLFAWEAYEKGGEVHLQADPTKLEILNKEFAKRKDSHKSKAKDSIVDKYGGQEHLEAPSKQLLMAQSEDYVEYSRHGTVIKGQEKAKVKSRYEEDVYLNNHYSVWGSYWHDGQWGFQCCHSCIKESYCTGEAGRQASVPLALDAAEKQTVEQTLAIEAARQEKAGSEEEETPKKSSDKKKKKKSKKTKKKKSKKRKKKESSSESSSEEESEDEDAKREKRIKEATEREKLRVLQVDKILAMDERKRPYNSMLNVQEPDEDEMEAFVRKKIRSDDPMAKFLSGEIEDSS